MKHKIIKIVVLLFSFCISTYSLFSQWEFYGPAGCGYTIIAKDSVLITDSGSGYISLNQGLNWQRLNAEKNINAKKHIDVSSKNMVLCKNNSLFISTDNGKSWINNSEFSIGLSVFANVNDFVFAGTTNGRLYKTSNYGETWTELKNYKSTSQIYSILSYKTNLLVTCDLGISISTDMGENWTESNMGFGKPPVYDLCRKDDLLFAATFFGIYVSNDEGYNWSQLARSTFPSPCRKIISAVDKIFTLNYNGIFFSSDNGLNWNMANNGIEDFYNIKDIAVCDSIIYAMTWGNGVYKTNYDKVLWKPANNGIGSAKVSNMFISKNEIFAFTELGGLYKSPDSGSTWENLNIGFRNNKPLCFTTDDSLFYAGVANGLLISYNRGATWQKSELKDHYVYDVFKIGNTILAGVENGILRSEDKGKTWNYVDTSVSSPHSFFSFNSKIFASTMKNYSDCVLCSIDSGKTWNKTDNKGIYREARCFGANNEFLYAGFSDGIKLSTDLGITWINAGLNYICVNSIAAIDECIFAATDAGVFISSNNGLIWYKISKGGIDKVYSTLATIDSNLYAASTTTGVNILRYPKILDTPNLILPLNHQITNSDSVQLVWSEIPNTLNYRLQIATDSTFKNLLNDDVISDNTTMFSFPKIHSDFYWRVQSRFGNTTSNWSNIFTFTNLSVNVKLESSEYLTISPNPTSNYLNISYSFIGNDLMSLVVIDNEGKIIEEINNLSIEGKRSLNTSLYSSGNYKLIFRIANRTIVYPIVIMK